MQISKRIAIGLVVIALSVVVYATASYPTSVATFPTRANGQTIDASWFNLIQDEIVSLEGGLINGLAHDLKFTDGLFDIGKSGATRPRDIFLSRNATVGGTLDVTGTVTHSGATTLTGVATFTAAPVINSGDPSFKVGASSETHKGGGIINVDSTQAATGANTTDTLLFNYSLPADALNANGRTVRFTAWGTFAANGNTKTIRMRFNNAGGLGGTAIMTSAAAHNGTHWRIEGIVYRLASNSQEAEATIITSGATPVVGSAFTSGITATDTGAITMGITAQNGTAAASDIVYEGSIVEFLN